MTATHERMRKKVVRGARLLDRTRPNWWRMLLKKASLFDLSSSYVCVLGVVFDDGAAKSHPDGTPTYTMDGFTLGSAKLFEGSDAFRDRETDRHGFIPPGVTKRQSFMEETWLRFAQNRADRAKAARA